MLILEELGRAQSRGARIYGEVIGFGSTADAYRITDIHPEGRGAVACIEMALRDAGLNRDGIDYIKALKIYDLCGGVAQLGEHLICIQEVAGSIPVASTKFNFITQKNSF